VKAEVGKSAPPSGEVFTKDIPSALKKISKIMLQRHEKVCIKKTRAAAEFFSRKYPPVTQNKYWIPFFGSGILLIGVMRTNGYWTGQKVDQAQLLVGGVNAGQCRYCKQVGAETREHLILHCSAWATYRQRYIARSVQLARNLVEGQTDSDTVALLLGGTFAGKKLPYWDDDFLEMTVNEIATSSFEDTQGEDGDIPIWGRCVKYEVAGFLNRVNSIRKRKLLEDILAINPGRRRTALADCQGAQVQD
jgi:hypothetical protein